MARDSIKITNYGFDHDNEAGRSGTILRGLLDPESLGLLKTADYQREVLQDRKIRELMVAYRTGRVPDIELGMRGVDYIERGGAVYLQGDTYIIDGLQRITAAMQMMADGGSIPRVGTSIHIGTSEEWERERFKILNAERTKVSANVLLRNLRHTHEVVELLFKMSTTEQNFVLFERVSWTQRKRRGDLMSALTLLKTVSRLHAHAGPGLSNSYDQLAHGAEVIRVNVGDKIFRANVAQFFLNIDAWWGIRSVVFGDSISYLRGTFLLCLAALLSRHTDFWKGEKLFIDKDLSKKIRAFPINDPSIKELASASGQADKILYRMLVDHVNSGKRTKHLSERPGLVIEDEADEQGNGDESEGTES